MHKGSSLNLGDLKWAGKRWIKWNWQEKRSLQK